MRNFFLWVRRIVLIAIVLYLVLGVVVFVVNNFNGMPSVKDAPWVVQTYSNDDARIPGRFYIASKVEFDGNTPKITSYWSYDGKRYHRHRGSKEFPVDTYGTVGIVRRIEK